VAEYASLADVYEFLTPEPLLTPEGNVAAFAPWIDPLPAGARVLDCACGIGLLAVGLALRGFEAHASDASPDMIRRTRGIAATHGVDVPARVCAWEDLPPEAVHDAVFCVGNSLPHTHDRITALRAMAATLAFAHAPSEPRQLTNQLLQAAVAGALVGLVLLALRKWTGARRAASP